MSPFHFCPSAAMNLSSFQLLHVSLITDLLQLFLGLPLFLFLWGFQSRAAFGISPSSFLYVWPIHLNFLFLISKFISSCPVTFHRSLMEIIFGHHRIQIMIIENCQGNRMNNDTYIGATTVSWDGNSCLVSSDRARFFKLIWQSKKKKLNAHTFIAN